MKGIPQSHPAGRRTATALAASTAEYLGLATLVASYETGDDLTPVLQQLLELQATKRREGLVPADMRAVLNQPALMKLREAVVAVSRHRSTAAH
jgi:hypothetical protein